jgi:translation initiation factor 2 alpha subunit (eIF-2alpha)
VVKLLCEALITVRPDCLSRNCLQVADAKGWFHLIHKRYQDQQEAIAQVEWAAEQRLRKALREQEERLKREHEAKMKAFADFDRQVLRGG